MKNKKISYVVIAVLCLVITITGATYAFFALQISSNNIVGTTANVGLILNVDKISPETQGMDDLIPQLESALGTAISSTHKCIDGNSNVVCQVYRATITNNGSSNVKLSGTITFSGISNIPHLKWKMITDATTVGSNTGVTASTTATTFVQEVSLSPSAHQDYYFVIWIDETNSSQNESGTFGATITFDSSDGQGLTSTIGANSPSSSYVYTVNLGKYYGDGTDVIIGQAIPNEVNARSTPDAVIADWTGFTGNYNIYYLKHKIENGVVSESYAEFVIDNALKTRLKNDCNGDTTCETQIDNLVNGTYTLRGGVDESEESSQPIYEANVATLKQAFNYDEQPSVCSDRTYEFECSLQELSAIAAYSGFVRAGYDDSYRCIVDYDGSSYCVY